MTREAICREVKFSNLEIPKILQIVQSIHRVFLSKVVLVKLCGEYLTYADSFNFSLLVLVKFVLNMQGFVVYIQ